MKQNRISTFVLKSSSGQCTCFADKNLGVETASPTTPKPDLRCP